MIYRAAQLNAFTVDFSGESKALKSTLFVFEETAFNGNLLRAEVALRYDIAGRQSADRVCFAVSDWQDIGAGEKQ